MQWDQFAEEEPGSDVCCICYHALLNYPDIITPYFTDDRPWYANLYMKATFQKLSQTMRKSIKFDDIIVTQIN